MTISNDPDYQQWLASRPKLPRRTHASSRVLTYKGESHTINEWAKILSLPATLLRKRLSRSWSVEQTLETPMKVNQYQ